MIAVVGTGSVGTTLARIWHDAGLDVVLASRTPEQTNIDGIPLVPVAEALAGADIVVTAIPGTAMPEFLAQNAAALRDKVLVDASNSIGTPAMHHAAIAGGLTYFRAFNTLGVENFAEPDFDGITADLFYSGPQDKRDLVEPLIAATGMRGVWVGDGPQAADLLDGLTRLWFTLALQQGRGRHLAFRMLP